MAFGSREIPVWSGFCLKSSHVPEQVNVTSQDLYVGFASYVNSYQPEEKERGIRTSPDEADIRARSVTVAVW